MFKKKLIKLENAGEYLTGYEKKALDDGFTSFVNAKKPAYFGYVDKHNIKHVIDAVGCKDVRNAAMAGTVIGMVGAYGAYKLYKFIEKETKITELVVEEAVEE